MIEIKHIQQVNDGYNWKCGAVCLEMIFNHYDISCSQDTIWTSVQSKRGNSLTQKYAKTCDLAKYSISKGLSATIYKTTENSFESALKILDYLNKPAILSVKEKKSNNSHFIVYMGYKNGMYYFCDPNIDKSFSTYKGVDLKNIWKPCLEIDVTGYIFITFGDTHTDSNCPFCNCDFPILIKQELEEYVEATICPYCDRGSKAKSNSKTRR